MRTLTNSPQVPNQVPAGRFAPGTFSERVSRPTSVYALPYEVPTGCSVSTATIARSSAPTVPVVCSAGRLRSTAVAARGAGAADCAGVPEDAVWEPHVPFA